MLPVFDRANPRTVATGAAVVAGAVLGCAVTAATTAAVAVDVAAQVFRQISVFGVGEMFITDALRTGVAILWCLY